MQGISGEKFRKRIAEVRQTYGFPQEGFAHECGFDRSYTGAGGPGEEKYYAGDGKQVRKIFEMHPLRII